MLWDLLPFPAFIINDQNLILSVNHATELYFLSSSKLLLNKDIIDLFPGSDLSQDLLSTVRDKKETRVYYDLNFNFQAIIIPRIGGLKASSTNLTTTKRK